MGIAYLIFAGGRRLGAQGFEVRCGWDGFLGLPKNQPKIK